MKVSPWILCLSLLSSCAAQHPAATALVPSSQPAAAITSGSAPEVAANPASKPAGGFDAEGYLQPVDPFELRVRPKAYSGELTIVAIASDGSKAKAGDVLLQIDSAPLNRQLASAQNELLVAQASVERSEASAKLALESDALRLRQQQDETRAADDSVKWWETVDGPQMLLQDDLVLKESLAAVGDQQDELDQLKKMYKSEELTSSTADIVVKRALRALEIGKARLSMTQQQVDKSKTFEYPIARQKPLDAQTAAHIALEQLKLAQAQATVIRKTELAAAHAALDEAQRKVGDLTNDLAALTIHAPSDGVVAFGGFSNGAFGADPKSLRPGERVAPQQVLMTLYVPGKLAVRLDLPEDKFVKLHSGLTVSVQSTTFADAKMQGECGSSPRTPAAGNGGPQYTEIITLHDVDPRLAPGSKVKVHADPHNGDETASR